MTHCIITDLKREESIDKVKKFSSSFSVDRHEHLKRYEEFISSLGIPSFRFYVGKSSQQLKCRTLTGPEKLKVIASIDVPVLLSKKPISETQKIQALWCSFHVLNKRLTKRPEEMTENDYQDFGAAAKLWVGDFLNIIISQQ